MTIRGKFVAHQGQNWRVTIGVKTLYFQQGWRSKKGANQLAKILLSQIGWQSRENEKKFAIWLVNQKMRWELSFYDLYTLIDERKTMIKSLLAVGKSQKGRDQKIRLNRVLWEKCNLPSIVEAIEIEFHVNYQRVTFLTGNGRPLWEDIYFGDFDTQRSK